MEECSSQDGVWVLEEKLQHCLPSLVRVQMVNLILHDFLLVPLSACLCVLGYMMGIEIMVVSYGNNLHIDLLQRRIGTTSNLEWITKLTSMLSPFLRMLKLFMDWRIIWKVKHLELEEIHLKTISISLVHIYIIRMINLPFNAAGCGADIHVIVKFESADSIPNLHSIYHCVWWGA